MDNVQVAISPDFLKAFARIPKAQQKKVREFTEKFRANPMSPGINYEKIRYGDPKVRSVRIDKTYRAIVVKPPKGDVYLCAWVDHHDDAYDWAKGRRFEVNPKLGHLQVYNVTETVEEAAEAVPQRLPVAAEPKLFDNVKDDELELFGVPKMLIPAIRNVSVEAELDQLQGTFPADVCDALYYLAGGMEPEELLEELCKAEPIPEEPIDTEDFEAALKKPKSLQQFAVVDKHELKEALTAPLEQWRIFLHPDQKKLVEWNVNGPIRVLGGAGTGKTVALLHRAAYLAKSLGADERILVTTFTKNLALELKAQLARLCDENYDKVEVKNLDAWAWSFLSSQGVRLKTASWDQERTAWLDAHEYDELGHSIRFYQEEWKHVVQAQDVMSQRGYFKASRKGRGTRLSRAQRAKIWLVFEKYREQLELKGLCEFTDVVREARLKIEALGGSPLYRHVLADEIQDFRNTDFKLLRVLAPETKNDIFLVGDPHQRIYGYRSNLSQCGIKIVGRSRRLKVNYRTTAEIGRWALTRLHGRVYDDLDGGTDNLKGYHAIRSGAEPLIKHFTKGEDETKFVLETVKRWLAEPGVEPHHICVTTRMRDRRDNRYKPLLENAGIDTIVLSKDTPESEAPKDCVRVATMHRMKGLEFPRVLVASPWEAPMRADEFADEASREDWIMGELSLCYVAATRARDVLAVCDYGDKEWYVSELE